MKRIAAGTVLTIGYYVAFYLIPLLRALGYSVSRSQAVDIIADTTPFIAIVPIIMAGFGIAWGIQVRQSFQMRMALLVLYCLPMAHWVALGACLVLSAIFHLPGRAG